jgi:MBG domain (YGX type)/Right handed beta helix region
MLSTITLSVNTLADDPNGPTLGYTTLRDAITQADVDTANQYAINFAVDGTIDLTSALPDLSNNIVLDGPGALDLTVQRDPNAAAFSVFTVDSGVTVNLSGMTIAGGNAGFYSGNGGGVDNFGTLTVSNSVLSNNSAWMGGGIYDETGGKLAVSGTSFTGNSANVNGGGIFNDSSSTATVSGSTFTGNSALGIYFGTDGGGVFNEIGGMLTVRDSIFANNSASLNGGGIGSSGILTVSGSTFTGNVATNDGGGIFNDSSNTATVSSCTFSGNTASVDGGGVSNELGGSLTVSGTTIYNNSASLSGGGIFNDSSSAVTVLSSTLSGNTASSNGGGVENAGRETVSGTSFTFNSASGDGGGVDNFGTLTVSNSVVLSNSAWSGGGICDESGGTLAVSGSSFTGNLGETSGGGINSSGTATVSGCSFTNNSTFLSQIPGTLGGGVFNQNGGTLAVSYSSFTGNSAYEGGGIDNYGTATVSYSAFTSNSAAGDGGGIANPSGTVTLTNCTVGGNTSGGDGGGMSDPSGTVTLTNCTVSGNTSQSAGGGIANGQGSGNVTLNNTIVAGNISTVADDDDIFGQILPASAFNLIGDGSGIFNLADLNGPAPSNLIGTTADPINPLLGPLAKNGGPTLTMALLPGSPAINAGSNALAVDPTTGQPLPYDQRGPGFPRIVGKSVDIGAYEFSRLSQTIQFGPLAGQTYGHAPITLNATATSGLPVSFSVISGPAKLSGSVLTVTAAGKVVVEASQAGNAYYSAATSVDESLTVSRATLTITPTAGQFMVYGAKVPALTYTASGFVNGDPASLLTGGLGTTAISTSAVGTYPFTLGSLTAGTNYTLALAAKPPTFAVTPARPTITWANPAAIAYGTALSATQLDATASWTVGGKKANVAGTFTYKPTTGTVLNLGDNQPLSVSFTPTDTTDYTKATATALINVVPATQVTWANPAAITYGTALSATQLDATASLTVGGKTVNVAGTFTFNPKAGTVLNAGNNQTLSVSFTPTDTTDYTNATATALINVVPATPTITWANPAAITYGTALSSTQLDATASWTVGGKSVNVAGTFTYNPKAGTVLKVGNNQTLSVSFTPTDTTDYTNATATALINVVPGIGPGVVVGGKGNDNAAAGNGPDLVVVGLGKHKTKVGSGNHIHIGGSATSVRSGDSPRQILSNRKASSSELGKKHLKVVYNRSHPNA